MHTPGLRYWTVVLLLLLAPVLARAGDHGSLRIAVRTPDGEPLPGARVLVIHKDTWRKTSLTTDEEGRVFVYKTLAGDFRVRIEAAGHRLLSDARDCLVVIADRTLSYEATLAPLDEDRVDPPPCPRLEPQGSTSLVLSPNLGEETATIR